MRDLLGRSNSPHAQLEVYANLRGTHKAQLHTIWRDLEVSEETQAQELSSIDARACRVWTSAVIQATQQRDDLQERINHTRREIRRVQEQLGEPPAELSIKEASVKDGDVTTITQYEEAASDLDSWHLRRAARLEEFTAVEGEAAALRIRLGRPPLVPGNAAGVKRADLSLERLEADRVTLKGLHDDRRERESHLHSLLQQLRVACDELGEPFLEAAMKAHPSFANVPRSSPGRSSFVGATAADLCVDLSPGSMAAIDHQLSCLRTLKAARALEASQLLRQLEELYLAADIESSGDNCSSITALMNGPTAVHANSILTCKTEIERLEAILAAATRAAASAALQELESICSSTCLDVPSLPTDTDSIIATDGPDVGGQAASLLKSLEAMVAAAAGQLEARAPILGLLDEVSVREVELDWLATYEADNGRYKGRDSQRNLQRSMAARKWQESMPALLTRIATAADEWAAAAGQPFLLNGHHLKEDIIQPLLEKLHEAAVKRTQSARAMRATSVCQPVFRAGGLTPVRKPSVIHHPTAGSDRGTGAATPQPRLVTPGLIPLSTPPATLRASHTKQSNDSHVLTERLNQLAIPKGVDPTTGKRVPRAPRPLTPFPSTVASLQAQGHAQIQRTSSADSSTTGGIYDAKPKPPRSHCPTNR